MKKIQFWQTIKSSLPFLLGLIIGASLTRNKYVWLILIFYVIMMFSIRLFAGKAIDIKKSTDKKLALKNAGMSAVNTAADYIGEGNSVGGRLFDKVFPVLSVYIGICLCLLCGFYIYNRSWFSAFIILFTLFSYIVLVNIWRKVKYLGVDKDGGNV